MATGLVFQYSFPRTQGHCEEGEGKHLLLMEAMLGNWCPQSPRLSSNVEPENLRRLWVGMRSHPHGEPGEEN